MIGRPFSWERDPVFQWEYALFQIKLRIIEQLTGWMRRIPIVGRLVQSFWSSILDDGIVSTCRPRYGMLTFAFLNDGIRPTLWHTWQEIRHPDGPYAGIYIHGAPRSLAHARQILHETPDCTSPVTEEDEW